MNLKSLIAFAFSASLTSVWANPIPDHLYFAQDLVANIQPDNNQYASQPSIVEWPGYQGAETYSNRSVCATFVTELLKYSYSWNTTDFKNWFGSTSPNAAKYHDAIVAENQFVELSHIGDIQPGDIIAVKYPEDSNVSGHVMLVANYPSLRVAKAPFIENTVQYDLEVIDSSRSGHGPADTRMQEDGTWDDGVGHGVMRLYANNNGEITGYTWSTYSSSIYYDQSTRHLVIGRLL